MTGSELRSASDVTVCSRNIEHHTGSKRPHYLFAPWYGATDTQGAHGAPGSKLRSRGKAIQRCHSQMLSPLIMLCFYHDSGCLSPAGDQQSSQEAGQYTSNAHLPHLPPMLPPQITVGLPPAVHHRTRKTRQQTSHRTRSLVPQRMPMLCHRFKQTNRLMCTSNQAQAQVLKPTFPKAATADAGPHVSVEKQYVAHRGAHPQGTKQANTQALRVLQPQAGNRAQQSSSTCFTRSMPLTSQPTAQSATTPSCCHMSQQKCSLHQGSKKQAQGQAKRTTHACCSHCCHSPGCDVHKRRYALQDQAA